MSKQYHILNGDALKEQFPPDIEGTIIVARECLIDGNVQGEELDHLFASRAKFLSENYGGTEVDYYENTVAEFQKIQRIEDDSDINLWFEDDLFCQINLWFLANLLSQENRTHSIYLIRPESHDHYGFGGLDQSELISIYENRSAIPELNKIASLWGFYQNDELERLLRTARELESIYPFILPAVEAHIQRTPSNGDEGRPIRSLRKIMEDLETEEFGPVFREFNKRESIYGFGDLQVKRLLDRIKNNRRS